MLYSNKKYDISELVLASIVKDRKISTSQKKISAKAAETQSKRDALRIAKIKKREEQKKLIQEKREAKLKERDEKRKLLLENKKKKS